MEESGPVYHKRTTVKRRKPKRAGLFIGYWFTLEGRRIERVKRAELAEAYRLLAQHRDIAGGRPRAAGADVGLELGKRMPLG